MNFQAIVSIPLPMERKLHSEACTEFKIIFYGLLVDTGVAS